MRQLCFLLASLALALVLGLLVREPPGGALWSALLLNGAVVTWSSFVLPLRGLPRAEWYFHLRGWERSGRLYHALGVGGFRHLVRRGPLACFNRALPRAWHTGDLACIERETRAAEVGHIAAFAIVLVLAGVLAWRGDSACAVWAVGLSIPLNLYPVLLQRDHRVRLARHGPMHHTRVAMAPPRG
jgi:hypothetical protein